ncbi:MAG: ATP-binding protein [Actinomycetota bacterium]|nr:ATP-binding protein [Actinomycetota bacterium]
MSLPAEPASAAAARRFVRDVLAAWGAGEFEDSAVLLTSELVTNALLHARSAAELHVRLAGGRLRVGVSDRTPVVPVRKRYGKEAATGRGILLVETMASAWGTDPNEGGKEVWFELTGPDGGQAGVSADVAAPYDRTDGDADPQVTGASPNRRRSPNDLRAYTRHPHKRVREPARS